MNEKSFAENVNDISIRKDSSMKNFEFLGLKLHADKLNASYQELLKEEADDQYDDDDDLMTFMGNN